MTPPPMCPVLALSLKQQKVIKSNQASFHSYELNGGSERGDAKSAGGSWSRPRCGCGAVVPALPVVVRAGHVLI